jgi:hypothetical protein
MQNNYAILDGAVGTIAEHSTQIAEKANAVHTHSKADITDFPAYGTTAGTICEGNDSRLSDARTPVAHTHTKSDVTDLLNSNFIPSANNSYDLGSSSYQWNNLYAKNYYYNGTPWGLDKANTWSGSNIFTDGFTLKNTSWSGKVPPSSRKIVEIPLSNSDTVQSRVMSRVDAYSTETWITTIRNVDASTSHESTLIHTVDNNGNRKLQPLYGDVALGAPDSGSRFKTLNGVNPGALGIPSGVRQSILEYITDVNLSWNNQVTAVRDGYIIVTINDAAGNSIYLFNNTKQYSNGSYGNGSQGTGRLTCMLPVNEGDAIIIFIKAAALSDVFSAFLYVMNGNVNALPSS